MGGNAITPPGGNSSTSPSFWLVLLSGAVGGMVYWILQVATGVMPFGSRWYGSVPAALLVGGVAAFLGVYLLANSDTTHGELKHTLAFALVCGITWSTVIAGAKQQVISATSAVKADAAQDKTVSLQKAIVAGNSAEVSAKVSDAASAASQAVQTLSSITDDQVKAKIVDNSQEAVKTIFQAAKIDPAASIAALKTVGTTATDVGAMGVRVSVIDALSSIEKDNPALASQTAAARQALAIQSSPSSN
jgi:hypothetical protein